MGKGLVLAMKITLLMAITLDGKIGKSADHFPDWTGKADKKLFVDITRKAGVVIMGSKTFDTIKKPLPDRKNIVLTRNPDRKSEWKELEFTSDSPRDILLYLQDQGYSEAVLVGGATINSLFARESLIDEVAVTVSPFIFGTGLSLFAEGLEMNLQLNQVERIGKNRVFLKYAVLRHHT